jgi:uncharacterized membrane protein YhaH (DUF805 family)
MFKAYTHYWDFQGRAPRAEYWLFSLWIFLLGIVAGILDVVAFHHAGVLGPCALFVTFANLIPHLAVSFRRLHDIDRSAWWMLIAAVPILGALVLLVFTLLPGTRGENRFGPETGQRSYEALEATFA